MEMVQFCFLGGFSFPRLRGNAFDLSKICERVIGGHMFLDRPERLGAEKNKER